MPNTGMRLFVCICINGESAIVAESVLLYGNEEIVSLAFLQEKILTVDEILGGNHLVESRELLLVQAHAATFDELTHLALGGEDVESVRAEEINSLSSELSLWQTVVGHVLKDIIERCFVEACQLVLRRFAKENV